MKVLIIGGLADSLITFRGELIDALSRKGCEVHACAPNLVDSAAGRSLVARGVVCHDVALGRTGLNPLADVFSLISFIKVFLRSRPDAVIAYTAKPVIYGLLAAKLAGVPSRYALITGLGYAFSDTASRWISVVVEMLYRLALRNATKVFFQNLDDEALFRERALVSCSLKTVVVNGSGVDLKKFAPVSYPEQISFLLIARLLAAKGVRLYAAAARRLKVLFPESRYVLVGWLDGNPDAISESELQEWVASGDLIFKGKLDDVRPALAEASVFVLPTYYREGVPRTILEAMAMGRPVITTDSPGCRDAVSDGFNGYLVRPRDLDSLVDAMRRVLADPSLVRTLGANARHVAESKYDVNSVNEAILSEIGL